MPRIPIEYPEGGAAIRTARGVDVGLRRGRLRGPDVAHPFHGSSAVGMDLASIPDRCRALQVVLGADAAFSHTTALAIASVPVPSVGHHLHVSVQFPATPPQRPGVIGHALRRVDAELVGGVRVSRPVEAWVQSASLLTVTELVAVADHLIHRGWATPDELPLAAVGSDRRPGAGRLREAARRARPGVRSRPESLLRMALVDAGLPEPVIEHPVRVAGNLVLHPDLAYPGSRLALEYEGFDTHSTRDAWMRDIERRELLAEAGWRTLRVTSRHLFHEPAQLIDRVRRHLA